VRTTAIANSITRFQLKEVTAIGALAAKGIGIRVDDMALMGESYGTALGVVNLGTSLVTTVGQRITIVHNPAVPQIDWFVGGVLVGTQLTPANIPSGLGGANGTWMLSSRTFAAAGDALLIIIQPKVWQLL